MLSAVKALPSAVWAVCVAPLATPCIFSSCYARSLSGFLNVRRYFAGRRTLFIDSRCDRGSISVDLFHDVGDVLDHIDGFSCRILDSGNLRRNFFCGLGRLCRQFLHLGSNNRKALACFSSTGSLNGCVQSQKVGLLGDGLDKDDDFTNLLRSFIQTVDLVVGKTERYRWPFATMLLLWLT